jgi:type VI secretion system protein ImpK
LHLLKTENRKPKTENRTSRGNVYAMRDDIAEVVFKVLQKGIDLKERRERNEEVDFDTAQGDLLGCLNDARLGESRPDDLGARFALACWLDEILIGDAKTDWAQKWSRDYSLEFMLYRTRERAPRFWEGEKQAEARPGNDALEVYFLCSMLGFRGEPPFGNSPEDLRSWADRIRPQVMRTYGDEPQRLDNSTPQNHVPLLSGRDGFQAMLKIWAGVFVVLAFVLGFMLVKRSFQ